MAKQSKTKLDEASVAMLQRVAARMKETIIGLDLVMTIDGTHTLPHKKKEGGYRQLPVDPQQEFMLSDVYVGARGQIIFCYEPVDDQEYQHIEVDEKKMDEVFPLAGPAYAAAIDKNDEEDIRILIEETVNILKAEDAATAAAEERAKEEADQEYTTNPLFGRF